ncbi:MAG: flagellin [Desulfobacteraceae bacterium]|nr:flagellin [Desulfobacteraceae bacterium]
MTLRINTNVTALTAHNNMIKNDASLSSVLEQLSSGLRINKAADDAAGMAIADSLKSQALGLGQAVKNANDGISMVQTADGALAESINIVNTIKTKSIQAAQDGQTTDSRNAIQADINKLMQELDNIAKTTSFNGQKLLSGQFTNKYFQVGAYTGETVGVSIGSTESAKIGHVTTADLQASGVGTVQLSIYSSTQNQNVAIQSQQLAYDNSTAHGMGALADSINKVSNLTGVTAQANVAVSSNSAVAAGSTGSDFAINGITIGALTVQANDADGSLVNAINQKTSQTGVTASVDNTGVMTLTSDGRAIQVTGDTGTTLTGSNLSTLGSIKLFQSSANEIKISDAADNVTLNLTGAVNLGNNVTTTVDSTLTKNSVLGSNSIVIAGSTLGFTAADAQIQDSSITTTQDSLLKAGSVLGSNTVVKMDTILGGAANNAADITTSADSLLKTGSIITSSTTLTAGTTVTTNINTTTGVITAGTVLGSNVTTSGSNTLLADMLVKTNATIQSGSTFAAGSYVGGNLTLSNNLTTVTDMTLKSGSTIAVSGSGTSILGGSQIGGNFTTSLATVTLTQDMTLKAGSKLMSTGSLYTGSTIGGNTTTSSTVTMASDMTIAAGSQLASGSTLKSGTVLTNDIHIAGGNIVTAGTTLTGDTVTSGTNYLSTSMTLKANSKMASGSVFGASASSSSGASATTALSDVQKYRLSDIDVTTQAGAQIGISLADAALKGLDKVRSDLGSVQNQLTSTISNISVTQVNVTSAESNIRDTDFAEASSNFSRMQILVQAGSFAMAQSNASGKSVLSLLQG